MIRRPPRSTLFPLHDALPIYDRGGGSPFKSPPIEWRIARLARRFFHMVGPCMIHRKKDRKSTRLNSSHSQISYAVFCLKKKKKPQTPSHTLSMFVKSTSD